MNDDVDRKSDIYADTCSADRRPLYPLLLSNPDFMIPSGAPSKCTALGRQVSPGGAPEAEHT